MGVTTQLKFLNPSIIMSMNNIGYNINEIDVSAILMKIDVSAGYQVLLLQSIFMLILSQYYSETITDFCSHLMIATWRIWMIEMSGNTICE